MGDTPAFRALRILARAPNHLGDGVMAMPAIEALARIGEVTVQAPRWGADLYAGVPVRPRGPIEGGFDAAVIFPPSLRAAWECRSASRRIGVRGDFGRLWLLTDVVPERVHRRDTYAALVEVLGARVSGEPAFPGTWTPASRRRVGLIPISPSGATVEWQGFRALADRLDDVVFFGGPGEDDRVAAIAGRHPRLVGAPLAEFAQQLRSCAVIVANDSGAAHFARACGVPTIVVFGSTVPARTGAAGAIAVEVEQDPHCRPCYRKECRYALECLRIPVGRVLAEVEAVLPTGVPAQNSGT